MVVKLLIAGPSRGWGRRWVSYPGPATFGGGAVAQKYKNTLECAILKKKIQHFSPSRGPAKCLEARENISRAPLWLSTGLLIENP